jgi:hypothetical protein
MLREYVTIKMQKTMSGVVEDQRSRRKLELLVLVL